MLGCLTGTSDLTTRGPNATIFLRQSPPIALCSRSLWPRRYRTRGDGRHAGRYGREKCPSDPDATRLLLDPGNPTLCETLRRLRIDRGQYGYGDIAHAATGDTPADMAVKCARLTRLLPAVSGPRESTTLYNTSPTAHRLRSICPPRIAAQRQRRRRCRRHGPPPP